MTYYDNWSAFIQEAHSLFFSQPLKTRYSIKYVKGDKVIVLKVTDDRKCCKFKLINKGKLRQLHQLNRLFLTWSVSKDLQSPEVRSLKVAHVTSQSNKSNTPRT